MKNNFTNTIFTILSWICILLAFGCVGYFYPQLPDAIPIHFDINGEADNTGSKLMMWIFPILLPLLTYFIIQWIRKKNVITMNPAAFQFAMTACMSALSIFITYYIVQYTGIISNNQGVDATQFMDIKYLYLVLGPIFIVLGIFMKGQAPNKFFGARTPWTLKNDEVWRKTNKMAGDQFQFVGVLLMGITLLKKTIPVNLIFIILMVFVVIYIYAYSYIVYKNINDTKNGASS